LYKNQDIREYVPLGFEHIAKYFYKADDLIGENKAKDIAIRLGLPFIILDPDKPLIFITPHLDCLVIYLSFKSKNNLNQLKLFREIPVNSEVRSNLIKNSFSLSKNSLTEKNINPNELLVEANLSKHSIGGIALTNSDLNIAYNTGSGNVNDLIILVSYLKQQIRDLYGIQLREAYLIYS
jgi:hypothetical protein